MFASSSSSTVALHQNPDFLHHHLHPIASQHNHLNNNNNSTSSSHHQLNSSSTSSSGEHDVHHVSHHPHLRMNGLLFHSSEPDCEDEDEEADNVSTGSENNSISVAAGPSIQTPATLRTSGPDEANSSQQELVQPQQQRRRKSAGPPVRPACQECGKDFSNQSALSKHKLTHSDVRRFSCSLCGKAFKRQDHLNGHMLTHRDKKPYQCDVDGCEKTYCDARSLRRHKENHHNNSLAGGANGLINGAHHLMNQSPADQFVRQNQRPSSTGSTLVPQQTLPPAGNQLLRALITSSSPESVHNQQQEQQQSVQSLPATPVDVVDQTFAYPTRSFPVLSLHNNNADTLPDQVTEAASPAYSQISPYESQHQASYGPQSWSNHSPQPEHQPVVDNSVAQSSCLSFNRNAQMPNRFTYPPIPYHTHHLLPNSHPAHLQQPQHRVNVYESEGLASPASVYSQPQSSPFDLHVTPQHTPCTPNDSSDRRPHSLPATPVEQNTSFTYNNVGNNNSGSGKPVINSSSGSVTSVNYPASNFDPRQHPHHQQHHLQLYDQQQRSSPQHMFHPPNSMSMKSEAKREEDDSRHSVVSTGLSSGGLRPPPALFHRRISSHHRLINTPIIPTNIINTCNSVPVDRNQLTPQDVEDVLREIESGGPSVVTNGNHQDDTLSPDEDRTAMSLKSAPTQLSHPPPTRAGCTVVSSSSCGSSTASSASQQHHVISDPNAAAVSSNSSQRLQIALTGATAADMSHSHQHHEQQATTTTTATTAVSDSVAGQQRLHQEMLMQQLHLQQEQHPKQQQQQQMFQMSSAGLPSQALRTDFVNQAQLLQQQQQLPAQQMQMHLYDPHTQTNAAPGLQLNSNNAVVNQQRTFSVVVSSKTIANCNSQQQPGNHCIQALDSCLRSQPQMTSPPVSVSGTNAVVAATTSSVISSSSCSAEQGSNASSASSSFNGVKVITAGVSSPKRHKHKPEPIYIPPHVNANAVSNCIASSVLQSKSPQQQQTQNQQLHSEDRELADAIRLEVQEKLFAQQLQQQFSSSHLHRTPLSSRSPRLWDGTGGKSPFSPLTGIDPAVKVGSQFQARIPDFLGDKIAPHELYQFACDEHADLVFDPACLQQPTGLSEEELEQYLLVASSSCVSGAGRNIEYAYHLISEARGDLKTALVKLLDPEPRIHVQHPLYNYHYPESDVWSTEEITAYHEALIKCDKDFTAIARHVQSKNVKQCIQFYYLWKKVCPDEYRRLRTIRRKREQEGIYFNSNNNNNNTVSDKNVVEEAVVNKSSDSVVNSLDSDDDNRSNVSPSPSSVGSVDQIAKEFPCKVCGKIFNKIKSRAAHMKIHRNMHK